MIKRSYLLSIIVPAYSEEKNIPKTIEDILLLQEKLPYFSSELLIVDDGSTDRTYEVAKSLSDKFKSLNIKLYKHERNMGFGSALSSGKKMASGQLVTFVPADGQFLISDIGIFLREIKNADLVIGYRTSREADTFKRKFVSKVFLILVKYLFKINIRDFNWVHMYKREKFKDIQIESKGVFSLAEFIIRAYRNGLIIKEVPSGYRLRWDGKSKNLNVKRVVETFKEMFQFWFKMRKYDQGL